MTLTLTRRSIAVPSNWQLPHYEAAGGDRPIYTNVSYPWQEWQE